MDPRHAANMLEVAVRLSDFLETHAGWIGYENLIDTLKVAGDRRWKRIAELAGERDGYTPSLPTRAQVIKLLEIKHAPSPSGEDLIRAAMELES